jgi:hypothetical protein
MNQGYPYDHLHSESFFSGGMAETSVSHRRDFTRNGNGVRPCTLSFIREIVSFRWLFCFVKMHLLTLFKKKRRAEERSEPIPHQHPRLNDAAMTDPIQAQ